MWSWSSMITHILYAHKLHSSCLMVFWKINLIFCGYGVIIIKRNLTKMPDPKKSCGNNNCLSTGQHKSRPYVGLLQLKILSFIATRALTAVPVTKSIIHHWPNIPDSHIPTQEFEVFCRGRPLSASCIIRTDRRLLVLVSLHYAHLCLRFLLHIHNEPVRKRFMDNLEAIKYA